MCFVNFASFSVGNITYALFPQPCEMEENDAIVVARKWLIEGEKKGPKLAMEDVEDAIVSLKSLPKENIRLRLALIHLGNELVSQNCVELNKDGGIRPNDVIFNT